MTNNIRGALFGLAAFGLFATHDAIIKVLGGTFSPIQVLFFIQLFSFPLVSMMLVQDRQEANLRPHHPWWSALRMTTILITTLCAVYAFSTLPLAQVYAILFATPLVITVLSVPFLGERVGIHRAGAVCLGLIGVLVVMRPGATDFTLGHMAALTAVFCGAISSLVLRKIGQHERDVVLLLLPMIGSFVLLGAALPYHYQPMSIFELGALALVAALAFAAFKSLIIAYKKGEAGVVAPMQYSQIIWAAGYGYVFFGETIDTWTLSGVGLIIISGVYIVFREAYGSTSVETPVLRTRGRVMGGANTQIGPNMEADDAAPQPERRN